MDSREVSLIVHLLFNGDTGVLEVTGCTTVFGKELTVVVKAHVLSDCPCSS